LAAVIRARAGADDAGCGGSLVAGARDGFLALTVLAGCVVFILAALAAPAGAHTEIVRSEPEQGEELERPPGQVRLFFEEPVEAEFSPLRVYDARGERVDEDNARTDSGTPAALVVDLRDGLPAGSYTVEYRYTGVDGHVIEGSYQFSAASAAEPAGGEAGADGPAGRLAPEGASASGPASGPALGPAPVALYAVLGLGALALGALAIGGLALRRR
jgi:methionine-rich copper-binding protein CopC